MTDREKLELIADLASLPPKAWWDTLDEILALPTPSIGTYPKWEWVRGY